jgi:hypothetical protein
MADQHYLGGFVDLGDADYSAVAVGGFQVDDAGGSSPSRTCMATLDSSVTNHSERKQ